MSHNPLNKKQKQTTETAVAGVCRHARTLIKTIDHAITALKKNESSEALHAFRVNIRRLRTQLAAFSDVISLSRAVKRQLRRLAQCTNEARDIQVAAQILSTLATSPASPAARVPQARLRQYRIEAAACIDDLQASLPREWARLRRRLLQQLSPCNENDSAVSYRHASRRQFDTRLRALRQCFTTSTTVQDIESLHRARILTKQLRYLLEPFAATDAALAKAIRDLVLLQDTLGSIHDCMLLRQRIKAEALKRQETALIQRFEMQRNPTSLSSAPLDNDITLYRYLHTFAKRQFTSLAKTALGDNSKPFIANLHQASRCLR